VQCNELGITPESVKPVKRSVTARSTELVNFWGEKRRRIKPEATHAVSVQEAKMTDPLLPRESTSPSHSSMALNYNSTST